MGTLYFSWSVATFRAFFALFVSNHYNHHLAGRAKQQTRPAAAVFGRPGEFDAHSRWIRKLARSSARSTPREGAKRKKPGGRWSAAGRSRPPGGCGPEAAARRLPTAAGFFVFRAFPWCRSCRAPRAFANPSTASAKLARTAENGRRRACLLLCPSCQMMIVAV